MYKCMSIRDDVHRQLVRLTLTLHAENIVGVYKREINMRKKTRISHGRLTLLQSFNIVCTCSNFMLTCNHDFGISYCIHDNYIFLLPIIPNRCRNTAPSFTQLFFTFAAPKSNSCRSSSEIGMSQGGRHCCAHQLN